MITWQLLTESAGAVGAGVGLGVSVSVCRSRRRAEWLSNECE